MSLYFFGYFFFSRSKINTFFSDEKCVFSFFRFFHKKIQKKIDKTHFGKNEHNLSF